jgi:hypothetical protein
VTYSPALKWSMVILLPLTISWKATARPENPVEIQNAIIGFLTEQKFDVSVTDQSMEYMGIVEARSRSCQLRVAKISPLGHETDLVRRASSPSDRTFYVYRGAVYAEQPVRRTVAGYLWFRFLRELGVVSRIPPVLAVVTSCNAEQLPWSALGSQQPL